MENPFSCPCVKGKWTLRAYLFALDYIAIESIGSHDQISSTEGITKEVGCEWHEVRDEAMKDMGQQCRCHATHFLGFELLG